MKEILKLSVPLPNKQDLTQAYSYWRIWRRGKEYAGLGITKGKINYANQN